jgi:YebC/PmpR family DNA-binding regulatory protein
MSGHSKWSTIKRKKGKADAERGRMFTRLIKEITVAARDGGGDTDANPRLRTAIENAKKGNMPADNIKKAIQKGTGELPGVTYEESIYEGYGPGGAALFIETLTDNRNRTVAEIRHLFSKHHGNLGENGSVSWMFQRCGQIQVAENTMDEDTLILTALDCGADDVSAEEGAYNIRTEAGQLYSVRECLEKAGVSIEEARVSFVPQNTIKLEGKQAEQMLKLFEALEDHDDVQNVYANFDIDDDVMERFEG